MRKEISLETIERWLMDSDCRVRLAAANAMQGRNDVPLETIERGLRDIYCDVRAAAANAMQGRNDVPLETIERGLRDRYCDVREAAANAMQGRNDVPLETIERWLRDSDCDVRAVAENAMQGRNDVPLETIERWLRDSDWRVRVVAMNAYQQKGIEIPIIRTFEPPKTVYKKCFMGVIITAEIPHDAQVRGAEGRKCRANKAIITGVIGSIRGEPVGISIHDKKKRLIMPGTKFLLTTLTLVITNVQQGSISSALWKKPRITIKCPHEKQNRLIFAF